jgi:hypothetical protein
MAAYEEWRPIIAFWFSIDLSKADTSRGGSGFPWKRKALAVNLAGFEPVFGLRWPRTARRPHLCRARPLPSATQRNF